MKDVNALQVELLSAACVVDRIRMRYSLEDIAKHCGPNIAMKIVDSAKVICKYFSQLETRLRK
jgi:hypothetical protein